MSEFREMRRKRQLLSNDESVAILEKATAGTLALLGDDDYPYTVPISYKSLPEYLKLASNKKNERELLS